MNQESTDRVIDVSTVARREGVSTTTVRNWIYAGRLPAERTIGGRWKVRLSALIAAKKSTESQESQESQVTT
jgi:excisionase family DNA binding protein